MYHAVGVHKGERARRNLREIELGAPVARKSAVLATRSSNASARAGVSIERTKSAERARKSHTKSKGKVDKPDRHVYLTRLWAEAASPIASERRNGQQLLAVDQGSSIDMMRVESTPEHKSHQKERMLVQRHKQDQNRLQSPQDNDAFSVNAPTNFGKRPGHDPMLDVVNPMKVTAGKGRPGALQPEQQLWALDRRFSGQKREIHHTISRDRTNAEQDEEQSILRAMQGSTSILNPAAREEADWSSERKAGAWGILRKEKRSEYLRRAQRQKGIPDSDGKPLDLAAEQAVIKRERRLRLDNALRPTRTDADAQAYYKQRRADSIRRREASNLEASNLRRSGGFEPLEDRRRERGRQ